MSTHLLDIIPEASYLNMSMKGNITKEIFNYFRMIKFSHTIFALPFAGISILMALKSGNSSPYNSSCNITLLLILKISVCMAVLRSAAMGFNRLVDRKFDAANPRTRGREIPAGKISVKNTRIFIIFFTIIFVLTSFSINLLCGILSPIALLLVFGYSYSKRFTYLSHFILGFAIGIAPIAAWIAVCNSVTMLPVVLGAGLMFYIAGFDILYSSLDVAFDQKSGLFSLPSKIGIAKALWIARLSHLLSFLLFLTVGKAAETGLLFFLVLIVIAFLFIVEHLLVRSDNYRNIPFAFFHINASISSLLLIGLLLDYYIKL